MTIEEAFGQVIKDLRRQRGLTWKELTALTGLSHNGIWDIERGRFGPRLETLYKLANALQVAPESLIVRTSIMYRDNAD